MWKQAVQQRVRPRPGIPPALTEQQRVQDEQLSDGPGALPRHHVHHGVLAQRNARVHAPPLVQVLEEHDPGLEAAPDQEVAEETLHGCEQHTKTYIAVGQVAWSHHRVAGPWC